MSYLKDKFELDFKMTIHNIMYNDILHITEALWQIKTFNEVYGISYELMDKYLLNCRLWYVLQCQANNEQKLQELFEREQTDINETLDEILHQYNVYLLTLTI